MDPLSTGSAVVTVGQGGLAFLGFVRDHLGHDDVIAAMFDADGTRLEGHERVCVEKLTVSNQDNAWVYRVQPVGGFTFVAFAVHPAAELLFETMSGDGPNPTTQHWRWVAPRRSGQIENLGWGGPNLVVPFIVVGYRSKALVGYFERGPIRA
jgi:hypothetical protein